MTTLKERFEKYDYAVASCHDHNAYILAFIKEELQALADEVEKSQARSVFEAATLIRAKADLL